MKKIVTFLLVIFIGQQVVVGQCSPAAGLTCEEATSICALENLDGYNCTTLSTSNPTGPSPLCFGSGSPENTQWWSFTGNGQNITVTFTIDLASCSMNKGIEAGIMTDQCDGDPLDCNADCNASSFTISGLTRSCNTYYLWVDGCEADICDYSIQITNGEPQLLPNPLPLPYILGLICRGGVTEVCVEELGQECEASMQWSVDGVMKPQFDDLNCMEIGVPIDAHPSEICVTFSIGNGTSMNCDEKTTCTIFNPGPIKQIDDGELFICWEDRDGDEYFWRDTVINSSCINPPCKIISYDNNDCFVEYTAEITLIPISEGEVAYVFICDRTDLPYNTEDGRLYFGETINQEVIWTNEDNYNCDTSYILNLEVYTPELIISKSCPGCNDSILLESSIVYDPVCTLGPITTTGLWMNEQFDTLAVGNYYHFKAEDLDIFYYLIVQHTNDFTGKVTTCTIHDTSWHINIKNEELVISGDTSICQVDTSEYSLPESYSHGCKIEWTIEDVNGQIITSSPNKKATIRVLWPTHNTVDGKICAEIIDNCDSVSKVCFDLEGCVTTNNQNANQNQWSVFPNPARDIIYIQGGNLDKTTISMHDLEGNSIDVQPKQDISGAVSIDIEKLTSGIYLIQLSDGEKKEVLRFVKL